MTEYKKTLVLGVITVQDYNKTLGVSTVLARSFWPTIFVETSMLTDIAKDYIATLTLATFTRAGHVALVLTGPHPLLNDVI